MASLRTFALGLLLALGSGCAGLPPRLEPASDPGGSLEREQVVALLDEARRTRARGDLPLARYSVHQAITGAQRSHRNDLAADAHFLLGEIFAQEGLARQAAEAFVQAYALSRRAGDRARGVRSLNALANILLDLGDHDRAFEASAQALRLARSLGDLRAQSTALNNVGETHRFSGRYGAAMDAYTEALSLARRAGTSRDVAVILENMASTARRQGQLEAAGGHYGEALTLARQSGTPESVANILNTLSAIRLAQQRPGDAWLLAREAADLGRLQNLNRPLAGAYQNEGLAAWGMGHREAARRALAEAVRLAAEMDDRPVLAYAQWHLGRLMLDMGDRPAAILALDQALKLFRSLHLADESGKVETELRAMRGDQP
ncbi:MAG: tetratricopeptide repeat protein [Candidatus Rokubacteria bacterium]|nr:tetratricopeptide repeat protein [Candidatus Rokubacteria bacterium]